MGIAGHRPSSPSITQHVRRDGPIQAPKSPTRCIEAIGRQTECHATSSGTMSGAFLSPKASIADAKNRCERELAGWHHENTTYPAPKTPLVRRFCTGDWRNDLLSALSATCCRCGGWVSYSSAHWLKWPFGNTHVSQLGSSGDTSAPTGRRANVLVFFGGKWRAPSRCDLRSWGPVWTGGRELRFFSALASLPRYRDSAGLTVFEASLASPAETTRHLGLP